MTDPKNPFDFGTGRIDKDQWLRDIDAEQGNFVSQYSSAVNKHRAALMREAFADLRRRIANGDMLNRTADGQYQFGSALNREDKNMQEAYQRALGFMGDLARRQIQAPPAAEPEKKKYSTKTLNDRFIKYFNPSGSQESFTSLWNSYDDATRLDNIKKFLQNELNTGLSNYQDVEDYESLDKLKAAINDFIADPNITNLNKLGFTKNYLSQLKTEEQEEPKTEEDQVAQDLEAQRKQYQLEQNKKILEGLQNANEATLNFTWTPGNYEDYLNNYFYNTLGYSQNNPYIKAGIQFEQDEKDKDGNVIFRNRSYTTKKQLQQNDKLFDIVLNQYANRFKHGYQRDLENYFSNFGTRYESLYNDNKEVLRSNLSKLFATADNKGVANWENYFTKTDDGYLINGSQDDYGNYAILTPQGIIKRNMYKDSYRQSQQQYKEGGVIKGADGFVFDASKYHTKSSSTPTSSEQSSTTPEQKSSSFSKTENARLLTAGADIISMLSALVPGYGTAISAATGLGSTLTNLGLDINDGVDGWTVAKNAGFGLVADAMGLIPGLGGVGKGAKVARNLIWAVPKMMQWVNTYQGLQNAKEIKNSIMKITSPSSMTLQDWQNVSQAIQIMTGHGRSVISKSKIAGMQKRKTTATDPEYYIFTNRGQQKVSDETFKKLREARGSKERQELTEQLMGSGVKLRQTKWSPFNTSTRFGAFKEVPGRTQVTVLNPHKGWYSDENLYQRGQNWQDGFDFRSYFNKINPYSGYYSSRNKGGELPAWLRRPVEDPQIIPAGPFGATRQGMTSALSTPPPAKRRTLTLEQKQKMAETRAKNRQQKKEAEAKAQELKKQQEEMSSREAMLTDVPTTDMSKYSVSSTAKTKVEEAKRLNSRWSQEEVPDNFGPEVQNFYNKYKLPLRHKLGGVLKALRNGGIVKAQEGLKTEGLTNKYDNISDWTKLNFGVTEKQYFPGFMKARYDNRGNVLYEHSSFPDEQEEGEHFGDQSTVSAYDAQQAYYLKDNGSHIFGDVQNAYNTWKSENNGTVQDFINYYNKNVDWLRSQGQKKLQSKANSGGWREYNQIFNKLYGNYSPYDSSLEDIIGESTWQRTPNTFKGITDLADLRQGILGVGEGATQVAIDNQGHLITDNLVNPKGDIKEAGKETEKESSKATDSEGGIKTILNTEYKNPNDPTPYIIAGKTAMGLIGNRNIYKNLLDEMPQAPLRDPIDRKLAIVGWQEAIKQGQNQLADLRNATWMQHGSDQQTNLAGMYETEGKGRDIMNGQFMKDSERQFDTAQKSWSLDNDDTLYNLGVGDANRKSIADRARIMAQIRAAWRSGDNNILMGALSDTGNWLLKKYQREQDIVDKTKELNLGTPEEWAQSEYTSRLGELANKKEADLTPADRAKIQAVKAQVLREMRKKYSEKYYNTFGTNLFGGGSYTTIAKDGTKLEVAKLKARSKDNDRYVSMIKDLRTTRSRRRRR